MNKDQCFELGYVMKPQGVSGDVLIVMDVDDPQHYRTLDALFIEINHQLVPFFVEEIKIREEKMLAKFEGIDDPEEAMKLRGCTVYLPLDKLPKLKEGQYYFHQIIGYEVIDSEKGNIGTVETVYSLPHQDLLAVKHTGGSEILIPIKDDVVQKVDHDQKQVLVQLPEGLLDVYIDPFYS